VSAEGPTLLRRRDPLGAAASGGGSSTDMEPRAPATRQGGRRCRTAAGRRALCARSNRISLPVPARPPALSRSLSAPARLPASYEVRQELLCFDVLDNVVAAGGQGDVLFWDRRTRKPLTAFDDMHMDDVTQVRGSAQPTDSQIGLRQLLSWPIG
jgi:hypothetical protein